MCNDVYFGEVLLDTSADNVTEVFVRLGGNASADMWAQVVATLQEKDSTVAVRMKVKRSGKAATERIEQVQQFAQLLACEAAESAMQRMQQDSGVVLSEGCHVEVGYKGGVHCPVG